MSLNIHQKLSIAITTLLLIISMYDVLFHLLLGIAHILFESAEFVLDHIIDGLLEIGSRETEIVVFYLLILLIGSGIYRFYRLLPRWRDKYNRALQHYKNETLSQWQELSVLGKMVWWFFCLSIISSWLFFS